MTRISPRRFVPLAFLASGVLVLAEWVLQYYRPGAVAVLVYLHVAVFGPVLASGFWALVTELFDPYSARKSIARIGTGGTAGGLVGGLVTGSVGIAGTVAAVLPLLGILHLACWCLTVAVGRSRPRPQSPARSREIGIGSVFEIIRWTPHLQSAAGLVLLSAASAVFLDFVFKAEAAKRYGEPGQLVTFFAGFYTAAALLTFLCQIFVANLSIERLGLGRTAGTLPMAVTSGLLAMVSLPGLLSGALVRGAEIALRRSLFRSAYELFFTPVRDADRRRTKLLIDVGAERLGDASGGLLLALLLGLGSRYSRNLVLLSGASLAAGALYLAFRLQRSYVSTLAARLMSGAVRIPASEQSRATHMTLFQSLLEIPTTAAAPLPARAQPSRRLATDADGLRESLESGDEDRVAKALTRPGAANPALVPVLIRLLAWDRIAPLAGSVLVRIGAPACPQLGATLADRDEDFVIRRRIPGLLAHEARQSNADALLAGIDDPRFEVRYRVALALRRIQRRSPEIQLDRDRLVEWIVRELSTDRLAWQSRRLLDENREEENEDQQAEPVGEGASRSLRHVFNVLMLVLPADTLMAALTAVRSGDARLRGTAMEYLESVVPGEIWEKLWPRLEEQIR